MSTRNLVGTVLLPLMGALPSVGAARDFKERAFPGWIGSNLRTK